MRARTRTIVFHVFSALVLVASVLIGSFCLTGVFYRTWEAVRDFGLSIAYYFTRFFKPDVITPTVTQLPRDFVEGIPAAWAQFVPWAQEFGKLFISQENIFMYLERVIFVIGRVAIVLACCLPFFLLAVLFVWRFLRVKNKDHGKVSKPLALYLTFRRRVLLKVTDFLHAYVKFCKRYKKAYPIAFLCVWGYFFNVGTFVLEFFAFLFYFSASFDLASIFVMLVKLASDLVPVIRFLPWWAWLVIGAYVLDRWRRAHAYRKLNKFEENNREFIEERPIVTMLCGSMRKKKTTIITDMALSTQEMFREQALNDMRDINVKFKNFPWQNFELFIKKTIRKRKTPTLARIEVLVREIEAAAEWDEPLRRAYVRHLKRVYGYRYSDCYFGYDTSFGLTFNNGMKEERLFDLLVEYGRLYYIYTNPTSIVSNYAVRSDANMEDAGNFPKWKDDFFKQKPVSEKNSVMSHIADQDMFRLGRVSDEGNPMKDAFEYGVVCMTEIGKERGNMIDLRGQSKDAEEVNQVNDLFNMELKMIGHSATVYYYPYVRFLCDDQRPESWGADARDLCDIVDIIDGGKTKIILPLFAFGEALYLIPEKIFRKIYDRYTFNRGDLTLTKYLLMNVHALIYKHYKQIYNAYSVCTAKLTVQAGTMDEKRKSCKYYLCTRKIYSDRFSSDCYHKFYTKKALRSKFGILDMPQYEELNPSFAELVTQKSHFVNTIGKVFDGDYRAAQPKNGSSKRTR